MTPLIYYGKFVAWSVPPFIVATSALVEYGHSLISRSDLFCDKKYLVAPTFKTSIQRVFKGFPWFFKLPYNTFYIFSGWIKNWIHVCFSPFSLCLKINMDKTSQKAMKLQALITIQAMKIPTLLTMQAMKLPALATPPPQDQMILMSMALVYLLSLPLAFLYFLHITLLRLKIKNSSMKNRINNQNVVICFRSYIINNKWVTMIIRKKIKKTYWWWIYRRRHGHQKAYWRWAADNHRNRHGHRNIFWAKDSRRRTTGGIAYIYVFCILCVFF